MHTSRRTPNAYNKRMRKDSNSQQSSFYQVNSTFLNTSYRAKNNIIQYTSRFKTPDLDPEKIMSKFIDYPIIQKEIQKHFSNIALNAYIDKNTWQLVIKTKNHADHQNIQKKKKIPNAFDKGLELIEKKPKYHAAIHHVDENIDLTTETYKDIRNEHCITDIKRLLAKDGSNLKTIRITIDNKDKFNDLLSNGEINLFGCISKPVSEWIFKDRPNQCFKCQKFGHSSNTCRNQNPVCLRCSESHDHKDCLVDKIKGPFKCANCNGPHAAVDKSCPKIIEHMKRRTSPTNDFIRIQSDGLTYHDQRGTLNKQTSNNNHIPVNNVIQFIFELLRDLGQYQSEVHQQQPNNFLNLVKHYFGNQIKTNIQDFAQNEYDLESEDSEMQK